MMATKTGARALVQPPRRFGSAEQRNAVDAFGPEPVRFSDAPAGLGATDCCRSAIHEKIVSMEVVCPFLL
jgi:hypothetical protein